MLYNNRILLFFKILPIVTIAFTFGLYGIVLLSFKVETTVPFVLVKSKPFELKLDEEYDSKRMSIYINNDKDLAKISSVSRNDSIITLIGVYNEKSVQVVQEISLLRLVVRKL